MTTNTQLSRKIFLVGMPGAGKTYWGRRLSEAYGIAFTDMDDAIVRAEGKSIAAIFSERGEDGFRVVEHEHLQRIADEEGITLVACGGGTPCFHNNMQLMKDAGIVIYLQADTDQLLTNIQHSAEVRPLLMQQSNPAGYLADLLQRRKAVYEQADHILQTKDISLTTFEKIIPSCLNRQ